MLRGPPESAAASACHNVQGGGSLGPLGIHVDTRGKGVGFAETVNLIILIEPLSQKL